MSIYGRGQSNYFAGQQIYEYESTPNGSLFYCLCGSKPDQQDASYQQDAGAGARAGASATSSVRIITALWHLNRPV
ncbi:GM18210 [Drosophila sechellia]|uniref:GM18210 n=1 Tax=Drosophila sechellia TaxID=7238 RepID=B4I2M9_DROSE|nr:GM18210 [Drosophila sechellia]